MTIDDCYQLGYIVKTHGLKGEVQIYLDVDSPNEYQNLESVFVLQGQQLVPFFIESMSNLNGAKTIVSFEDVSSLESAQALKGRELYLPLASLPELSDNEFYLHEIVGYSLQDSNTDGTVGTINNVIESGPQLLFSVLSENDVEILIPYTESLLESIDKESKRIVLNVPEGLIDIYLEDNED
ncbi:ribosome maturation factor RimM [Roseivirga sp. E12]|uniref:ribosome maturation factor RimM n=1 Tax=Roseivirga sp. E12 TaxID=2819237 RepID=UPI001ABD155C|nr:ribosome maturation factor RimM [Roseivirga sp. E12]MBO3699458.1 16S rRNA processing protein RimM [Roseivirga sp. E12]